MSNLDTPLLRLSSTDHFTLRDACSGVLVTGGTGSGKTSGTGKALASALLRAGAGFLVLAAKPDEVELWQRYARENGRADSVLLFGERGGGFNFLTYELARQGMAGMGSVVECLMRVLEAARLAGASPGRQGEQFWDDATRQLLRNTIPVLYAATGTVRIPDIIRFVASAPTSVEQLQTQEWQDHSVMFRMLTAAKRQPVHPMDPDDLMKTASYWRYEFAQLDGKTRGNIAISLSTTLDRFNRGRLHEAFCTETTLVPELIFHGAIIVMDMPALVWGDDGAMAQIIMKYFTQRAILARNALEPRHRDRPVVIWADEAQTFIAPGDADYLATCRSSRACTVYLTQSLPTLYARIGGDNPQHRADMLAANLATKVGHANGCAVTNRWWSETIGRSLQRRGNYNEGQNYGSSTGMNDGGSTSWGSSTSYGGSADGKGNGSASWNRGSNNGGGDSWGRNRGHSSGESTSQGFSEAMDNEVEPAVFARNLRTGGPANRGRVDAIWFAAGKTFTASRRNYLRCEFAQ